MPKLKKLRLYFISHMQEHYLKNLLLNQVVNFQQFVIHLIMNMGGWMIELENDAW